MRRATSRSTFAKNVVAEVTFLSKEVKPEQARGIDNGIELRRFG